MDSVKRVSAQGRRLLFFCVLLMLMTSQLIMHMSCAESSPEHHKNDLRIISLSPALTRTLEDMGFADAIVGCTPFCRPENERAAIVGDLYEVDYEMLVRLQPTHVVVQLTAAGPLSELHQLAQARGWGIGSWPVNNLDDIRAVLTQLPDLLDGQGSQQSRELLAALDTISASTQRWPGRTLIVTGGQPLLAFGPDTYMGELLTGFGVPNALGSGAWRTLSAEDVVRIDPEGVIVIGAAQGPAVVTIEMLPIDAVLNGRVVLLDHPEALIPSSRVIEVATALKKSIRQLAENDLQTSTSYE
jgi:ABC-type hemin transport system substrate-binding protein